MLDPVQKIPFKDLSLLRKAKLEALIQEASENKEHKNLSTLETLWVHRFGLETLPQLLQIDSSKDISRCLGQTFVIAEEERKTINCVKEGHAMLSENLEYFQRSEDNSLKSDSKNNSSEKLKTFDRDELDDISNACDGNIENNKSELETTTASCPLGVKILPPPPPSLNRLRRWLPSSSFNEEDLRKAS